MVGSHWPVVYFSPVSAAFKHLDSTERFVSSRFRVVCLDRGGRRLLRGHTVQ
jgi:hypothetical protein